MRVASALRGGKIEVRIDSIGGTKVAEIEIPHTGGWEEWKSIRKEVIADNTDINGVHDLFFCFKGRKGCKLFNFDWWRFIKK